MGTQLTITQLIQDIEKNRLILPEFQRGYVWTSTQVRKYLASLYRGYPTGSFLIWKTPNPGLVRGASSDTDGGAFQLILDGQQRLTSLYTLLKGEPPPFYDWPRQSTSSWMGSCPSAPRKPSALMSTSRPAR